ncbi:Peptidase C39 family protein [Stieleria neptunia]|uniref:Peptidase C39 family protein n=1 Tax=Stieleria neptunia TaxID=2527979 RepID=A0A518I0M0_9BACT|nr:peptidase C39 [Stieleria neptunia]QDV46655.1 Peptidase C39 family protein [Stieleria neptunia]
MLDLVVATSVMICLCLVIGWFVASRMKRQSRLSSVVLCVSVFSAAGYVYFLNGMLTWARFVPLTAAIVWTNFAPIFLCVASAAALAIPNRPLWRRGGLSLVLGVFATAMLLQPIVQPVIRPVRHSRNTVWLGHDVCQQSGSVTCSPAAAATLLKANGIDAEEHQLVRWCLTDALGTTSLGLWRGLRLATAKTDLEPEVMDVTLEDLLSREQRDDLFPCLILVGFPRFGTVASPEIESRYIKDYGWPRGFRHSVVLYGPAEDGGVEVGDPSIGRERWAKQDLEILWRGEAVRLVRRES